MERDENKNALQKLIFTHFLLSSQSFDEGLNIVLINGQIYSIGVEGCPSCIIIISQGSGILFIFPKMFFLMTRNVFFHFR